MKTALLVACAALTAAAIASAEDSRPYVVNNGRAAPAAAPAAPAAPSARASSFGANAARPSIVTPVSALAGANAGAAAAPAENAVPRRAVRGASTRGGRRVTADTGGSGSGDQAPPPYFNKPGALIRTEGQLPQYSDPGNARTHSVEGGGFVDIDQRKARDSNRGPGVTLGAPDTRPSTNGSTGGMTITANGPAQGSTGGTSNTPPTAGSNSGGGRHDEGAPVGTGFDGSF